MAGTDPTNSFLASDFRTNILAAMTMALPNTVADQPTFRWKTEGVYDQADPAGNPYYWGATPVSVTVIPDLQVTCAVDISGSPTSSTGTDAGEFTELTARITLLDTQYQALLANGGRLPDLVLIGQSTYQVDYMQPSIALYDVEVYTLFASSHDAGAAQ